MANEMVSQAFTFSLRYRIAGTAPRTAPSAIMMKAIGG